MADPAVEQHLFQRRQEGERFLRRTDRGFGHDFEERGPGPVEIDPGAVLEMETATDVFLEMDPGERDVLFRCRYLLLRVLGIGEVVERDPAFRAKRPRV